MAEDGVTKRDVVRDRVLDLVDALAVGDAIPAERVLCEAFGVSRMTLRGAVDDLVHLGRLVRRHGSGTYVAAPKLTQRPTIASFSEDMRRRGLLPGSRTLSASAIVAGARLGRRLDVSPSERVLVFRRLRLADGDPMALETLHVPEALVPGLTGEDLQDRSFYELLAARYGITVTAGVQTIEPTVTNEEESAALGVPHLSPAFLFELTTRTDGGRTIEFVRSVHRGDRSKLTVELLPAGGRWRSGVSLVPTVAGAR